MIPSTDTLDTHVLRRPAEQLAQRYAEIFFPETVERYVDRHIADPSEEGPEGLDRTVDAIDARVQALWEQIRE